MKFLCAYVYYGALNNNEANCHCLYTHVQVLEDYWKEWKMNKEIFGGFVKFSFSDNKEVQGMLSSQLGEGWKASLEADRVSG